ncbi:MAG: hypothetical protein MJA83_20225, partial [Gammaproteobacteria bacterium]|nr:hypothetical protein [Gammaproteobacteria bacterium]
AAVGGAGGLAVNANTVALAAIEDVTTTINADTVSVTAGGTADVNITAGSEATVTATDILGSVISPLTVLTAQNSALVNVDADVLRLSAPTGDITGNIGEFLVDGSGAIRINGLAFFTQTTSLSADNTILEPETVILEPPAAAAGTPTDMAFGGLYSASNIYDSAFSLTAPVEESANTVNDLGSTDAANYANNYMQDMWPQQRGTNPRKNRRRNQEQN